MSQHTAEWEFTIEKKDNTWPGMYAVNTNILTFGMDGEEGIYLNNPSDAHLIAAAPALLAALKGMVYAFDYCDGNHRELHESRAIALLKAQETIHRAEEGA